MSRGPRGEARPAGAAPGAGAYVRRFSRTERALHWIHASAFLVMLGSGLVLYVPALAADVSRPLAKAVHLDTALAWAAALGLVVLVGDRGGLRRTAREIELFDSDDRLWLRGRRVPQGRFNPGQKLNAVATAAFAVLFAVSGFLLWYGERDTRFRLGGTVAVHDALAYASVVLLCGHLYLAVIHPRTRHALRGITLGTVQREWAAEHHGKWLEAIREQGAPVPAWPDREAPATPRGSGRSAPGVRCRDGVRS